jgi:hypothetical protein
MTAPLDPRTPKSEHIERLVGAVLTEQPLRRAPASLQARVLAELERRAALPWWRNSFMHWPLAVRTAFVLASLVIEKFALSGTVMVMGNVKSQPAVVETLTRPMSWAEGTADGFSRFISLGAAIIDAIPPLWLYAGIAIAITLYLSLLVLGAAAYRTLYVNK